MVPVIALVGRPNVGKSTLFNRLTKTRDAIVAEYAGLTRDRQYGEAKWQGRTYIVIDTGGISGDEEGIDAKMAEQSLQAIEEADAVLFMVDSRAGMTASDQMIAEHLRKRNKRSFLIANKVDTVDPDIARAEFSPLGLGDALPIAAAHGRGVSQMLEAALCEKPVLAFKNTGGGDEFIEQDAGWQAPYLDVEQMACEVERVLHSDTLCAEMRAKGLARAKQFTWEHTTAATEQVYLRAMSQS